jgi:hypothetical protein
LQTFPLDRLGTAPKFKKLKSTFVDYNFLERETGLEPATSTLGKLFSYVNKYNKIT